MAVVLLLGARILRADAPPAVRLGVYENPPHTFISDGRPTGFVVDVVSRFCQERGYALSFVDGTFAESIAALEAGRIDLLAPIAFTEARRQKFHYSRESIVIDWSTVILPPGSRAKDLSELRQGQIAGVRSDLFFGRLKEDLARQGLQVRFVDYGEPLEVVAAVASGSVDAGFIGRFTLTSILSAAAGRREVLLMPGSLYHEPLYFGVNRERAELLQELDAFMAEATTRGAHPIAAARQKWFAESAHPSILFFLAEYYLQIAAGIALVVAAVLAFNVLLRRKVRAGVQEVARQKSFFQNLFQNLPVGIVILDREGKILETNRELQGMFGLAVAASAPATLDDLISGPEAQADARTILDRTRLGQRAFVEGQRCTQDGRRLEVQLIAAPITVDGELIAAIGIYLDVTERKRLEEHLVRSRNLEAIGVLAGGIAHDFNNMLTGIVGNVSLARTKTADPLLHRALEGAEKAALRATGLTRQLLTFSKGGAPKKQVASVVEILEDALDLILSGSGIHRELVLEPGLPTVEVDVTQIAQVFHNLVLNAKEAMGESGHLRIHVRTRSDGEATDAARRFTYLEVELADDGPGIPDEVMSRLFTPYNTTKDGGSGLGLATSYSILRKHDGDLKVSSRLGAGATFTASLPVSDRPVEAPRAPVVRTAKQGRLLLMDDERMICDLFRDMVSTPGLELDVTSNSTEAVRSFRQAREAGRPHDLVFLDLTIPGDVGGVKTLELLRAIDPDVRAIATSGSTASEVLTDPGKYHFRDILAKPFGLGDLQTVLDRFLA